ACHPSQIPEHHSGWTLLVFHRRAISSQATEETLQFGCERRFHAYRLRSSGMAELQTRCMQEHALESLLHQALVGFKIPVLVIAGNREPDMRQVNADLVCAPGFQFGIQ